MFQVMFINEEQLPRHFEKRATWVVGLTSWNSRLGNAHRGDHTHNGNHLWTSVVDADEQVACGLQRGIASILHVDHPLIGSIEGQRTRENRER